MPRTAKVFMTNRSQAVRLPKDYQFSTDEVLHPQGRRRRHPLATAARLAVVPRDRRRWRPTRSWPTSRTCRCRSARADAALHAGHGHVLLHHEALASAGAQTPEAVPVSDVCMSVVTKAELLYGVEVSPRRAQDAAALAAFLPYVEALDFDDDAAIHYAEIRADLKKRGAMIGANDLSSRLTPRALGSPS